MQKELKKNAKHNTISHSQEVKGTLNSSAFFVKSKHSFKQFRNHEYFEHGNKTLQMGGKNKNQFVSHPPPFGVDNVYLYYCSKIAKNQKRSSYSRKRIATQTSNLSNKVAFIKQNYNAVSTKFVFPQIIQKANFRQASTDSLKKSQAISIISNNQQIKHIISLSYATLEQRNSDYINAKIKINIFPFLSKTFLKCELKYDEMNEIDFSVIKQGILEVYNKQKQIIDLKDIVNIKTQKELFQKLNQCKRYSLRWKQIIRYFFVSEKEVYQYQFMRLKDQIRNITKFKLNSDVSDIYIYDSENKIQITNFLDIIKNGPNFIYATDPRTFSIYQSHLINNTEQKKIADCVKKWKNIVCKDYTLNNFNQISKIKYNKIFNQVQNKRKKQYKSKNQNKEQKLFFIDRTKLKDEKRLFQP